MLRYHDTELYYCVRANKHFNLIAESVLVVTLPNVYQGCVNMRHTAIPFLLGCLFTTCILFFVKDADAHEVKCFSDGKLVYRHHVENIQYFDDLIVFDEIKTCNTVITQAAGCFIKIEK